MTAATVTTGNQSMMSEIIVECEVMVPCRVVMHTGLVEYDRSASAMEQRQTQRTPSLQV